MNSPAILGKDERAFKKDKTKTCCNSNIFPRMTLRCRTRPNDIPDRGPMCLVQIVPIVSSLVCYKHAKTPSWSRRLCPDEKRAYFLFLQRLSLEIPDNEWRARENKKYYRRAREAFLQSISGSGVNTLDSFSQIGPA